MKIEDMNVEEMNYEDMKKAAKLLTKKKLPKKKEELKELLVFLIEDYQITKEAKENAVKDMEMMRSKSSELQETNKDKVYLGQHPITKVKIYK